MPKAFSDKLRVKAGFTLLTLHAPEDFRSKLGLLPEGVSIGEKASKPDQVHWFVPHQAQLKKELNRVLRYIRPGVSLWIYYPKGTSGIQTDLTRDKGWDFLLNEEYKLAWIGLISFDSTWSVLGLRGKTMADLKKENQPRTEREIFKWVNPATKEVKLPADVSAALKKHKPSLDYFNKLAFTHKKEYLDWIVTAKKEETRLKRVKGLMEKLREKLGK